MVECNCCSFSCLAFHREGRRLGRQVPMGTWMSSKKTGRGQRGLWLPTRVRDSSQSTSQLLTPCSPIPVIRRRCGLSSHSCKGITALTDPLEMEMWDGRAG